MDARPPSLTFVAFGAAMCASSLVGLLLWWAGMRAWTDFAPAMFIGLSVGSGYIWLTGDYILKAEFAPATFQTMPPSPLSPAVGTEEEDTDPLNISANADEIKRARRLEHAYRLALALLDASCRHPEYGPDSPRIAGHRALGWAPDTWEKARQTFGSLLVTVQGGSGGGGTVVFRYPTAGALRQAVLDGEFIPLPLEHDN